MKMKKSVTRDENGRKQHRAYKIAVDADGTQHRVESTSKGGYVLPAGMRWLGGDAPRSIVRKRRL